MYILKNPRKKKKRKIKTKTIYQRQRINQKSH